MAGSAQQKRWTSAARQMTERRTVIPRFDECGMLSRYPSLARMTEASLLPRVPIIDR